MTRAAFGALVLGVAPLLVGAQTPATPPAHDGAPLQTLFLQAEVLGFEPAAFAAG